MKHILWQSCSTYKVFSSSFYKIICILKNITEKWLATFFWRKICPRHYFNNSIKRSINRGKGFSIDYFTEEVERERNFEKKKWRRPFWMMPKMPFLSHKILLYYWLFWWDASTYAFLCRLFDRKIKEYMVYIFSYWSTELYLILDLALMQGEQNL